MSYTRYILLAILTAATILAMHKAKAGPIIVAVIDTGFTVNTDKVPLCKTGRLDFTLSGTLDDSHARLHGSNVIGLIAKEAGPKGYCIVSIKVFKVLGDDVRIDPMAYMAALTYVKKLKPAVLNLSMAGVGPIAELEINMIKQIIDGGTQVVAAAGNAGLDLNKMGCIIYPACADKRIYVIGNSTHYTSNIGKVVDTYEDGSYKRGAGVLMTGTSQSAAIFTGQVIKRVLSLKKKGA